MILHAFEPKKKKASGQISPVSVFEVTRRNFHSCKTKSVELTFS